MSELERDLRALATELRWPETPALDVVAVPRNRRRRRLILTVALALVLAVAVALAVPGARGAILRIFHLGGVRVARVKTLPSAPPRPLDADLGPLVPRSRAAAVLGVPGTRLPNGRLHLEGTVVSVVLPGPLLLSELRTGPIPVLQKQLGSEGTHVTWWSVLNGQPALWIAGPRHLVRFPTAPARLAGNVLVWQSGPITYRLEGPRLTRDHALAVARGT
jgi:hypothetical protein